MKTTLFTCLVLTTALTVVVPIAAQQAGQPYQRPAVTNAARTPAVSPYLNLNRGGLPAVNYFGLVRPQVETAQGIQQLQQQQQMQQGTLGQNPTPADTLPGSAPATSATGLHPQFFNYSHYFPVAGRQGGSASSLSGARR